MKRTIKTIFITLILLFTTTSLFACSKNDKASNITFKSVTADEAKQMMDNSEDYIILDVRQQHEYDEFHIENAIVIPDNEIELKAPSILKDKDQQIFVYCRSGRRSKNASKMLAKMGYTNIIEFGGVIDWHYGFVSE